MRFRELCIPEVQYHTLDSRFVDGCGQILLIEIVQLD